MINLNQLRVFYHVAENMNLTKAAEKLYITQPAVRAQIKLFEEACGLSLLRRKGNKVFLTEEGKTLHKHAQKMFEYEKEVKHAIEGMRFLKQGRLQLGATNAYDRYYLPSLLAGFREAYPHIEINLTIGSSLELIHGLLDFKIEIALLSRVEENHSIRFLSFRELELVPVLNPTHPLAGKSSVPFEELADQPIIMREEGSGTRWLVENLFIKNNCTPRTIMETSNTELIKDFVQRGEAITFLLKMCVDAEIKEGKLATATLFDGPMLLVTYIAYLHKEHLPPCAQAFLDFAESYLKQHPG